MEVDKVIEHLRTVATKEHFEKLSHFGIRNEKALGVKIPDLRKLAKEIGINHQLALKLWDTEIHEARMLASMIENPNLISENQFDHWVNCFDSWDICDITSNLLVNTAFVSQKIEEYSISKSEFVKRTAFTMMCELAFHSKSTTNDDFLHFFEIIEREAWDERNFVRKAVNWALRQIGKRNEMLRLAAIRSAEKIMLQNTKSARWIASDALRELNNDKIIARVKKSRK